MKKLLLAALLIINYSLLIAQTDSAGQKTLEEMSLPDLLKIKIATNKEQELEEAPSIVSVITRKEIEGYGCRDVSDILRLVPGFEFGVDVDGIVGLGFRGIWVHEGKSLIMLNGHTLNDFGYGNNNFMGSLPAGMIERVEIIRGPGSAIYGAFAEVCVINIITISSKKSNNASFAGNGGVVGKSGYAAGANFIVSGNDGDVKYNLNIGYNEQPLSSSLIKRILQL